MAAYTELTQKQAQDVGRRFGLRVADVEAIPAGSVNSNYRLVLEDGTWMFARVYEEQDQVGAEGEARLLDHLAGRGVLTPRPLPRKDGEGFTCLLEVPGGSRAVAVFPWRGGEILCQKRVTAEVASEVGEQLARIHLAGASFAEKRLGRFNIEDMRTRLVRIAGADAPELRTAAGEIEKRLSAAERARDPEIAHGIIHGDLFRDNILWEEGRPAALLDFESASDGPWVYDLMVTVLAWCYGDDFDLALVRAMFAGYGGVRPLAANELLALENEGRIAALRFTVTRITDFTMRSGIGERVMRDWRRFFARHERLAALGNPALARLFA
jgi:homoserine kinase type II